MTRLSRMFVGLLGASSLTATLSATLSSTEQDQDFTPKNIIDVDVCILGGGASGSYAAVQLKDRGQRVAVIERNDRLGGHAETYYFDDGRYIDYGVEGVFNNDLSRRFFRRLGVQSKPLLPGSLKNDHVNFATGERVPPPNNIVSNILAATSYRLALQQYDYFRDGTWNLPDPVPEELLQPFGHFVEKHMLQGALSLIFQFAHNVGDLLKAPLVTVVQLFGIPHIDIFLEGGYITPVNGMYELYRAVEGVLGSDVLYQTTAINGTRSDSGVEILVQGADGTRQLVRAKKLLSSIPTTIDNLGGLDLDSTEEDLFGRFNWQSYYVAILGDTGIPDGINVLNTDPENGAGSLPIAPFQWALQDMGVPGYLASKIVGDSDFTADQARDLILSDIHRMGVEETFKKGDTEMVIFGSHNPIGPTVSNDDIRSGFYRQLYALQGRRSTYYTGLTFCSDHSSLLWAYTERVVDEMLSS